MDPGRPQEDDDRRRPPPYLPDARDRERLARAMADAIAGPDPQAVPALLCAACVDLIDVTGASVSLSGGDGLRALWWSSDAIAGELAEAQYTLGDGPCQTALDLVAPVLAADLARGPDARRWPVFAQRAVELGVLAVFSLPLGNEAAAIGTLDLYRDSAGPLSVRDQSLALPMGDAITFALTRLQSGTAKSARAGDDVTSWLDAAENEHEEVHYATGMLMVQLGVDPQHALARLRAYAFAQGRTVTDVARDVIAHRANLDD